MVATAAARPEPSQALRLAPGPADGTREAPGPLTFPSLRFPVCTVGVMISRAQAAQESLLAGPLAGGAQTDHAVVAASSTA